MAAMVSLRQSMAASWHLRRSSAPFSGAGTTKAAGEKWLSRSLRREDRTDAAGI